MMNDTPFIPDNLKSNTVVLIGFPSDENSSFMPGAALAPQKIRDALYSQSSNLCAENGIDLGENPFFFDAGDLKPGCHDSLCRTIEEQAGQYLERHIRLLSLGGDHAITYPIVKAHAAHYGPLEILHLDAHPDLYQVFQGNPLSHACPFARIMEEKLAARLVQVGIRGLNPHQREQAERFGVEVVEMAGWPLDLSLNFQGPIYLSLDLDVLDPAFAPGVSHPEPGGLSTREVIRLIRALPAPILGADIVECNPRRDPLGITAMAAAKFVKEIAGQMIASDLPQTSTSLPKATG